MVDYFLITLRDCLLMSRSSDVVVDSSVTGCCDGRLPVLPLPLETPHQ